MRAVLFTAVVPYFVRKNVSRVWHVLSSSALSCLCCCLYGASRYVSKRAPNQAKLQATLHLPVRHNSYGCTLVQPSPAQASICVLSHVHCFMCRLLSAASLNLILQQLMINKRVHDLLRTPHQDRLVKFDSRTHEYLLSNNIKISNNTHVQQGCSKRRMFTERYRRYEIIPTAPFCNRWPLFLVWRYLYCTGIELSQTVPGRGGGAFSRVPRNMIPGMYGIWAFMSYVSHHGLTH